MLTDVTMTALAEVSNGNLNWDAVLSQVVNAKVVMSIYTPVFALIAAVSAFIAMDTALGSAVRATLVAKEDETSEEE